MNLIVPLLVIDSPGAGRGQKEQVMKSLILSVCVFFLVAIWITPVVAVAYHGLAKVVGLLGGRR